MEETIGQDFQTQVHAALNDQFEEEKIYRTLKQYSSLQDINGLVNSLRIFLADPHRLHLFEAVRPFVAINHQLKYDRICPTVPGKRLKTIRLMRKGIEDLGFTFRGGLDYGTGVYVSKVDQKSIAEVNGLMPGDEIVRINGYDLSQALHSEILLLLKIRNQTLELKVRRMGLMPDRITEDDDLVWSFVEGNKSEADAQLERVSSEVQGIAATHEKDRKLHVSLEVGAKLGCGIGNNEEWGKGIFVCRVNDGSVADTLGFKVGDQVIEVNGISYIDIEHEEAVMNLKTSRHLTIILRAREAQDGPITAIGKPVEKNQPPPANQKITAAEVNTAPEPIYASVTKKDKKEPGGNFAFKEKETDWWSVDPESLFNPLQIDGRELKKVQIVKDGPLNMFLEGGNKTPLGGKIVVSDIYPDGAIDRSDLIHKGDQIMMCEGVKLVDVPLETAEEVFKKHMTGSLDGSETLRIIIAVTSPKEYEDEITFF